MEGGEKRRILKINWKIAKSVAKTRDEKYFLDSINKQNTNG